MSVVSSMARKERKTPITEFEKIGVIETRQPYTCANQFVSCLYMGPKIGNWFLYVCKHRKSVHKPMVVIHACRWILPETLSNQIIHEIPLYYGLNIFSNLYFGSES